MRLALILTILLLSSYLKCQELNENQKKFGGTWFSAIATGYAVNGAYLNFTGPSFYFKHDNWKFVFGMLPSLRFREDIVPVGSPKNPFIFPSLGSGTSIFYKHFGIQIPFYYQSKTAAENGFWQVGFGLAYRFKGDF